MLKDCQAIFFDLDGTLIDPKEGITKSIQFALEKLGFSAPSNDELTWCIGPSLRESFAQLMNSSCGTLAASALQFYRERYAETGMYEHIVYPGIEEMLKRLQKEGFRLFVATAKPQFFAQKILEHFGLASYFEKIYGPELDGTRSDKGELLAYALEASGISEIKPAPEKTDCSGYLGIMVGDRRFDMEAAIQNKIIPVGVTYGYGSPEELLKAGAIHLCHKPHEIYQWVCS